MIECEIRVSKVAFTEQHVFCNGYTVPLLDSLTQWRRNIISVFVYTPGWQQRLISNGPSGC